MSAVRRSHHLAMKTKRLSKKIQRLEARLQKGAKKLASLKQKLRAAEATRLAKSKRKRTARAREALIPVRVAALQKNRRRLTAKTAPKPARERTGLFQGREGKTPDHPRTTCAALSCDESQMGRKKSGGAAAPKQYSGARLKRHWGAFDGWPGVRSPQIKDFRLKQKSLGTNASFRSQEF